jgi:RecB family exonuclease
MHQQTDKAFAFSYSRLKAFEDCPRRYHETMVLKKWQEQSDLLDEGDRVHKALAKALMDGTPLPLKYRLYQRWVDLIDRTKGELLVEDEARWAINRDFAPVPWFAPDTWARAIADAVKYDPPELHIVDWKTGKSRNVDPVQLVLTSLMALLHFPEIQLVKSYFVWLNEGRATAQMINREEAPELWAAIVSRVKRLEKASEANEFPPIPGNFCDKWCPCRSCEHNGAYEGEEEG